MRLRVGVVVSRGPSVGLAERKRLVRMMRDGFTDKEIRNITGRSQSTLFRIRQGMEADADTPSARGRTAPAYNKNLASSYVAAHPPPKAYVGDILASKNASSLVEALVDFEVWCQRYEHTKLAPHQREWIAQFHDEPMSLILAPPGSGKSFLFSVQHTTWLIAGGGFSPEYYTVGSNPLRNRLIAIVSRTEEQAGKNFDGVEARLVANRDIIRDFGRFREPGLTWTKAKGGRKLVVAGREEWKLTGDPTLRIMSGKSAVLGFRADILKIDDLADLEACATPDAVDKLMLKFRAEVATRQQGGSRMWVIMARLPIPHCPSKQFEEMSYVGGDGQEVPVFAKRVCPAVSSFEQHQMLWPEVPGFPTWNELMRTRGMVAERVWETMFMQNAMAEGLAFCEQKWIVGDDTYPGCLDEDRTWGQATTVEDDDGDEVECVRVMLVDPSPSMYWGCFIADVPLLADETYAPVLIDIERSRLGTEGFYELIEEWHATYAFSMLIIERNAAHAYLSDMRFQDIVARLGIEVIDHATTGEGKKHTDYGVQKLARDIEHGNVRIPWADEDARSKFSILVEELLNANSQGEPTSRHRTNDCLMALWFGKFNLAAIHAAGSIGEGYQPLWDAPASIATLPGRLKDAS